MLIVQFSATYTGVGGGGGGGGGGRLSCFVIGIETHLKIIALTNQNSHTTETLSHTFNFGRVPL